jgi:hypothetical protein
MRETRIDDDSLKSKNIARTSRHCQACALTENHRLQSSPSIHNPADIFNKIKSRLKQADKTKNRALGIQGTEFDGSCDPSDTSKDARRADDKSASAKIIKSLLELEPSTIQTPSEFHHHTTLRLCRRI